jgi:16S rRNA (guanine966-N2)-methyltransferase
MEPKTIVLDLFAGTGALAIEALSRGADYAVLLDKSPTAVKVIHTNLNACRLIGRAEVKVWDIVMNLNCLINFKKKFNLVFMDPPYDRNVITPTLQNLIKTDVLEKNASIVVEHSATEPLGNLPSQIKVTDKRRYGKTLVSFLIHML